jgi:hypothetical protein
MVTSWLDKDPLENPSLRSPFDDDSYSAFAIMNTASEALVEAEEFTTTALDAKSKARNHTFAKVVFAVVLFLAGLSRQFRVRVMTIGRATISAAMLSVGILALILPPTLT